MRGAHVIATVSTDLKAMHARNAGADETINYRTEDIGGRVKALTGAQGVDVLLELDLTGNANLYPAVLRPHSTVIVYGSSASEATVPSHWLLINSATLRFFLVYELSAADRAAGLTELTQLLEQGRLIHTVARRLSLEAIAEAHEVVERGKVIGHVVVDVL